jgi:dihydrofolate reductase
VIELAIVVAAARNGVIGRANAMPWHLPQDLRHFKRVTMGKPIVMGRKTFESIGKPLPGRVNIVVTRNAAFDADGVRVASSLDAALALARQVAAANGVDSAAIIGGAEIYRAALPLADRLYLTEIHADIDGDAALPAIDWSRWQELSRERHAADASNPYDYSFVEYKRTRQ